MKRNSYKIASICLLACILFNNQTPTLAQTAMQSLIQTKDCKKGGCSNEIRFPVEQTMDQTTDQTEDQQRAVQSIKIVPYDTHEKHLMYDHHMLMGEDRWLQAEIYLSDGTVVRTDDAIIKGNDGLEQRKVKWVLKTKDGEEPQAACLDRGNNRVEILSRCGCPEKLEIRAVLLGDETIQSEPYEIDVLEYYTDPTYGISRGQKEYFHFSSGVVKTVEISHEKEEWNRETGEYTVLLPKIEQKNELFVFRGWLNRTPDKDGKEQIVSGTSLTQERRLSPGGCNLVAQWSKRNAKFK